VPLIGIDVKTSPLQLGQLGAVQVFGDGHAAAPIFLAAPIILAANACPFGVRL
jgi:hypothetical protein